MDYKNAKAISLQIKTCSSKKYICAIQRLRGITFVKWTEGRKKIITAGQVIWCIKEGKQKCKVHAKAQLKRKKERKKNCHPIVI